MLVNREGPPFGPDDDVAGKCPTCGHVVQGKGRDVRMMQAGFNQLQPCVECPACRARTPKTGGRAVVVSKLRRPVLDFQI